MKHIMASLVALFCLLASAHAQVVTLNTGQSASVRFDVVRVLEKGTPLANLPNINAQASFTLDHAGTTLTINLENTGTAAAAVLYAFDLGLSPKLMNQIRVEATFNGFPDGGEWLGPVDSAAPTAGTGYCTFASQPALFRRLEESLDASRNLPAGFLRAGQRGTITVKLLSSVAARELPLRFEPRFYFLAPAANAPQTRRMPLVVSGAAAKR